MSTHDDDLTRRLRDKLQEDLARPTATQTFGTLGIVLFIALMLAPISALMLTYYASTLWGWFLSGYGTGPTRAEWFGFSVILSFATTSASLARSSERDFRKFVKSPIGLSIERHMVMWMQYGVLFLSAFTTGTVLGYIVR